MGRLLAIDYGKKRTGLAVSDPLQIIASGLTAIDTKEVISYLKQYLSRETADAFIIGDSINLDGSPSEIASSVRSFAGNISHTFPDIPIHWIDERFTSKIAQQSTLLSGMKKKKRQEKKIIDEISATLILQTFMEKHSFNRNTL